MSFLHAKLAKLKMSCAGRYCLVLILFGLLGEARKGVVVGHQGQQSVGTLGSWEAERALGLSLGRGGRFAPGLGSVEAEAWPSTLVVWEP